MSTNTSRTSVSCMFIRESAPISNSQNNTSTFTIFTNQNQKQEKLVIVNDKDEQQSDVVNDDDIVKKFDTFTINEDSPIPEEEGAKEEGLDSKQPSSSDDDSPKKKDDDDVMTQQKQQDNNSSSSLPEILDDTAVKHETVVVNKSHDVNQDDEKDENGNDIEVTVTSDNDGNKDDDSSSGENPDGVGLSGDGGSVGNDNRDDDKPNPYKSLKGSVTMTQSFALSDVQSISTVSTLEVDEDDGMYDYVTVNEVDDISNKDEECNNNKSKSRMLAEIELRHVFGMSTMSYDEEEVIELDSDEDDAADDGVDKNNDSAYEFEEVVDMINPHQNRHRDKYHRNQSHNSNKTATSQTNTPPHYSQGLEGFEFERSLSVDELMGNNNFDFEQGSSNQVEIVQKPKQEEEEDKQKEVEKPTTPEIDASASYLSIYSEVSVDDEQYQSTNVGSSFNLSMAKEYLEGLAAESRQGKLSPKGRKANLAAIPGHIPLELQESYYEVIVEEEEEEEEIIEEVLEDSIIC